MISLLGYFSTLILLIGYTDWYLITELFKIELILGKFSIPWISFEYLEKELRPGITTEEIDKLAYDFITKNGGYPTCLGFEGYPASICTSVNDTVVHGIPGKYKLKFEFDDLLINANKLFYGCNKLISLILLLLMFDKSKLNLHLA